MNSLAVKIAFAAIACALAAGCAGPTSSSLVPNSNSGVLSVTGGASAAGERRRNDGEPTPPPIARPGLP